MTSLADVLKGYGLTSEQYQRGVSAHELGHALIAARARTIDSTGVEFASTEAGSDGGADIVPRHRGRPMSAYERAVALFAGPTAQALWLQEVEGIKWSRSLDYMVESGARDDAAKLKELGLTDDQLAGARAEARRQVGKQWRAVRVGTPVLSTTGRLDQRQLRSLAGQEPGERTGATSSTERDRQPVQQHRAVQSTEAQPRSEHQQAQDELRREIREDRGRFRQEEAEPAPDGTAGPKRSAAIDRSSLKAVQEEAERRGRDDRYRTHHHPSPELSRTEQEMDL